MAMSYTLHHIIFEEPVRAFDWWMLAIEGVVLVLIAVEVFLFSGPKWRHEREARKQAQLLIPFLERGEDLKSIASTKLDNWRGQEQFQWLESVKVWNSETQEFLSKQSPRALSSFNHIVNVGETDRAVVTAYGSLYPVQGIFGDAYQVLQARLDNLQKIMDNPEVYF